MSYKFIDHTADIAAEINGSTYEELFISAAYAWKVSVIEIANEYTEDDKFIRLSSSSLEILLVDFLNELNFLLIVRKWVTVRINEISLTLYNSEWQLTAKISGTHYSPEKHTLKTEIKAITFHQMQIERTGEKFSTRIVFDI